ncbi:hypothetical protein OIU79_000312 [Salix purpurea]|uniref:Uncharacterized protein n=1 Tax=Salix purpurea TaxID=77065 RepID=A0A9Q0V0Z1_SALPP|nr:hypothetical protein OIU79_000312 [Salix purpurea]
MLPGWGRVILIWWRRSWGGREESTCSRWRKEKKVGGLLELRENVAVYIFFERRMKENIFFEGWKQWSSAAGKLGFTAPERRGLSRWPRAAFERNKGEITAARTLGS